VGRERERERKLTEREGEKESGGSERAGRRESCRRKGWGRVGAEGERELSERGS